MKRVTLIAAALFATVMMVPAQAEDIMAGGLKLSAPWARATPKGASVGGGYLSITNAGKEPDRLIGGATDVASRVEIHEMTMDNGVMKMRKLANGLEIKPGQTVELKPGGYHVMFLGMKQPLKQGEHFKTMLEFAKAGKVDVTFMVEGIAAMHGGPDSTHDVPGMQMKK
jgi:copper(I)-binding protein